MTKILAVDDNRDSLYYLESLLIPRGYDIATANDGAQALARLGSEKFDLIISDVLMPVMDGFLFCRHCQKNAELRKIPFIFFTATYSDDLDEDLGLKLGATRFVKKPIEPEAFLRIIEDVLSGAIKAKAPLEITETDDEEIQRLYSESLIRKLEEKNLSLAREISERKKTEEALKVSEQSFKAIFEEAAIGVAEVDSKTLEFLKINQKYCEIVGYSKEELFQMTFKDITHPDDVEASMAVVKKLRSGEITEFSVEKRYVRKDGKIVWVQVTVSPLWKPGKEPTTQIGTIHDITDRKLAVAQLRQNEDHLRMVLEKEPECVMIIGAKGELVEINPAGLRMLGAEAIDEIRGKQFIDLVTPEYKTEFEKLSTEVLGGSDRQLEFEIVGLKGKRRWLEINATRLVSNLDGVVSLLAVSSDITERKKMAIALSESEDRYRDLVENSFVLMLTHDLDGIILSINKSAASTLEYEPGELIGRNIKELFIPKDLPHFDKYIAELKSTGFAKGIGRVLTKSGKTRIGEFSNTLRTEGVEKPTVRGIGTDITDRIYAERALERSERDYRTIFEQAHDAILIFDPESEEILEVNKRACEIYGFSNDEFVGMTLDSISENPEKGKAQIFETLEKGEFLQFETVQFKKDGTAMVLEVNAARILYKDKVAILSVNRDITGRRNSEALIAGQKQVLEMVALGKPLEETMLTLLKVIEAQSPGMLTSIMLLDEEGLSLKSFAYPRLPKEFMDVIDGELIGRDVGSCGRTAFLAEKTITENIETDPNWKEYREIAVKHNLRACWSIPILDSQQRVLGTFATYYRKPGKPNETDIRLIDLATGTAAIAISRARSESALVANELRLKEAQKAGRIGDWEYFPKSDKLTLSETLFDIFELDKEKGVPTFEEILGFYEENDRIRLTNAIENSLKTGEGYDLDLKVLFPDGRTMFVSTIGHALVGSDGKVVKLHGVSQDITERKISEEEVRFQAHLLNAVKQSVISIDLEGKIVYWNTFAEALFGWKQDEVAGRRLVETVLSHLKKSEIDPIAAELAKNGTWSGELILKRKNGESFPASSFISPVTNRSGKRIGYVGISLDVSESKTSQLALEKSEERLRSLFDQMIDGFYFSSEDGKLLEINPAMVKMFGYSSKEEMLKVDVEKDLYFDPADRVSVNLQNGVEKSDTYRMRRKDGSEIWVEDNGRHILDDEGNVIFHEGVLRDVTERKLIQDQIQETNERLAISQDVAKIGSFEWNLKTDKNYWSPGLEAIWGLKGRNYKADYETWKKLVHPEDLPGAKAAMKYALETGDINGEYRIIVPDGEVKWMQARAKLFKDSEGNPLRLVGIHMDITEKKNAEREIAEANVRAIRQYENLLGILASLAQMIGGARDISGIFRAVLKFTLDSVPCDSMFIFLSETEEEQEAVYSWHKESVEEPSDPIELGFLTELIERATKSGEVSTANISLEAGSKLKENGGRVGSALIAPMKIKGNVIGVIAVRFDKPDVYENEHRTAMRLAANLVANAIENVHLNDLEQEREEKLQRSQKLESVGRLAGGIAHDFNNMLTAITGYSELVLKRLEDDDPIRQNVLEIKKAGERSAELTRQLLAFSRKQVLQLKVLSVNDIVTDTMLLLKRLIGEDLTIEVNLEPELGLIESDPGQLSQVLVNLVVNARDAMPYGGYVYLSTSNVTIKREFAGDPMLPPAGEYVHFSVRDTGVGMAEDVLENIFEPFFTTKVVGKGTGLGLATVYGIIKQSNGHIFVESKPEHGTVFRIYLPRIDDVKVISEPTEVSEDFRRGTETILVVEDETMVRSLTRQVLEECGYTIHEAGNGIEALEICRRLDFKVDLVLTDVVMPKMGGREFGERLGRLHPEIPILFTSGYADDANLSDFIIATDSNFIAKPFTFHELSQKVRDFIDARKNPRHG